MKKLRSWNLKNKQEHDALKEMVKSGAAIVMR